MSPYNRFYALCVLAVAAVLMAAGSARAERVCYDFTLDDPYPAYECYGPNEGYGFTVVDPDSCVELRVSGGIFDGPGPMDIAPATLTQTEYGLGVYSKYDCTFDEAMRVDGYGDAKRLYGDEIVLFDFDPMAEVKKVCFDWVDDCGYGLSAGDSVRLFLDYGQTSIIDINLADYDFDSDGMVSIHLRQFLPNLEDRMGLLLGISAPDCNDNFTICGLKVEVDCPPPPPNVVPLPASAGVGVLLLTGMAVTRGLRRLRGAEV